MNPARNSPRRLSLPRTVETLDPETLNASYHHAEVIYRGRHLYSVIHQGVIILDGVGFDHAVAEALRIHWPTLRRILSN